jgi:hypothetical protein
VEVAGLCVDLPGEQRRPGTVRVGDPHDAAPRERERIDQGTHLGIGDARLIGEQDDRPLAVIGEIVQTHRERRRLAGRVIGVAYEAALRGQGERCFDSFGVMSRDDHELFEPRGRERIDRVLGERSPAEGHDLLGGSEPSTRPGRQHDPRDHGSKRRSIGVRTVNASSIIIGGKRSPGGLGSAVDPEEPISSGGRFETFDANLRLAVARDSEAAVPVVFWL